MRNDWIPTRSEQLKLARRTFLVLEREHAEKKEAETVVSNLKRQFSSLKEKSSVVDVEIEQYSSEIANLRRGSSNSADSLVTATHMNFLSWRFLFQKRATRRLS